MQDTWETQVQTLSQEDALAKEIETHSSIIAWRIPRTEEPGGLQATGSQSQTRWKWLMCTRIVAMLLLVLAVHQRESATHSPSFFGFPPHSGHHRWMRRVGCVYRRLSVASILYTAVYICQCQPPNSQPPSPLGIHTSVLHVCVSISALQINSSVPFFYTPHINNIMFFSFWLTSLCVTGSKSIHVSASDTGLFFFMTNTPLNICTTFSIPLLMDI